MSGVSEIDFEVVEVREVSRHYGRRRALARASLTCRAGEIVGLFGPNGAGKSTLLNVLATLARPTSGEVRYGERTSAVWGDALRGRIGVLGHDLFLYGDLTVRENLEFFGRLYGIDRDQATGHSAPVAGQDTARATGGRPRDLVARVDAALQYGRLEARADDRASTLSRGLRQRLAVERALLHGPRLLLLDEPFTGLDDESSGLLVTRLAALRAEGTIVVMATHDFDTADGLVDRGIAVVDGRLAAIAHGAGTLRDRYRRTLAGGAA
jgi:ABC-type multidrug transport system ATPase subunit